MVPSALYRRWRPQTFGDLLGQEHVVRTLQAALREGRTTHAYLFSGGRGTGKTSTARLLAKAINCLEGDPSEPCNRCASCVAITEGSSLDVIEIDAASHGGVDDVRELRESVGLAPASARRKVYIVDEAHMVSTQGWNAFLKTVEEPPEHVVFVFATTEPTKVLPTILSRCQRFEFRPLATQTIADHLRRICDTEGIVADEAALLMIARAAEGGARDALSTLDQLASGGAVTVTDTARLLGVTDHDSLFRMGDAIVDAKAAEAIDLVGELVDQGMDLRVFARGLLEHLRGLLFVVQLDKPEQVLDLPDDIMARYRTQAARTQPAAIYHAMRALTQALTDIRQHMAPRLALEMALLRIVVPAIDQSAAAATNRISRLERILADPSAAPAASSVEPSAAPADAPQQTRPAPRTEATGEPDRAAPKTEPASAVAAAVQPGAGRVDTDDVLRAWPTILDRVRKAARSAHAQLVDAHVLALDGGVLRLEHPLAAVVENLRTGRASGVLIAAVRDVLGVEVRVHASERVGGDTGEVEVTRDNLESETIASNAFDPVDVFKQTFGNDLVVEE